MAEHVFQHPDEPTWCINCSTFKENCRPGEQCQGQPGAFDSRTEQGRERIIACLVGAVQPAAEGGEA